MDDKFLLDEEEIQPGEAAEMETGDFEEGDPSEEGDFVEEDWEAYDDEDQYIDDGDGDGGKSARAANFNKILIGGAVVLALGVGGVTMFGSKKEELGLPVMEQTGEAVAVSPEQKVEFHADTKVDSREAFGITYGASVDTPQAPEEATPPAGLLNNPGMIEDIRNQQQKGYVAYDNTAAGGPVPEVVEDQPPMPSPISTADTSALTPMPQDGAPADSPAQPESPATGGLLPTAEEVALAADTQSEALIAEAEDQTPRDPFASGDEAAAIETEIEAPAAPQTQQAVAAAPGPELDAVLERLGSIETSLANIEELKGAVKALERRIAEMEEAPVQTTAKAAAPAPVRTTAVSRSSAAAPAPRQQWVLKSAQPGRAMVAKKGENDMVDVAIGETLAGLGRITGIYMQDGQWIVQGTNGKITQ